MLPMRVVQDFFFLRGILAPAFLASLSAMATACLRFFGLPPLPDLSLPSLNSFITLWTLRLPFEPDVFVATKLPPKTGFSPETSCFRGRRTASPYRAFLMPQRLPGEAYCGVWRF